MIELTHEMNFRERIEGPLGPTDGSPARLCWSIVEATLTGERIEARSAMPGTDWIRIEPDGIRRQDQRTQFLTDDGVAILMRYDAAIIRADEVFTAALAAGEEADFGDHYMFMTPQFEVADERYRWLTRNHFVARGDWPVRSRSSTRSIGSPEPARGGLSAGSPEWGTDL